MISNFYLENPQYIIICRQAVDELELEKESGLVNAQGAILIVYKDSHFNVIAPPHTEIKFHGDGFLSQENYEKVASKLRGEATVAVDSDSDE